MVVADVSEAVAGAKAGRAEWWRHLAHSRPHRAISTHVGFVFFAACLLPMAVGGLWSTPPLLASSPGSNWESQGSLGLAWLVVVLVFAGAFRSLRIVTFVALASYEAWWREFLEALPTARAAVPPAVRLQKPLLLASVLLMLGYALLVTLVVADALQSTTVDLPVTLQAPLGILVVLLFFFCPVAMALKYPTAAAAAAAAQVWACVGSRRWPGTDIPPARQCRVCTGTMSPPRRACSQLSTKRARGALARAAQQSRAAATLYAYPHECVVLAMTAAALSVPMSSGTKAAYFIWLATAVIAIVCAYIALLSDPLLLDSMLNVDGGRTSNRALRSAFLAVALIGNAQLVTTVVDRAHRALPGLTGFDADAAIVFLLAGEAVLAYAAWGWWLQRRGRRPPHWTPRQTLAGSWLTLLGLALSVVGGTWAPSAFTSAVTLFLAYTAPARRPRLAGASCDELGESPCV